MSPSDHPLDIDALLRRNDGQRWLLALARKLVGGEQDAEDVAQETQLAAWLHPPRDKARAGGWLHRIARNVASRMRTRNEWRSVRELAAARPEREPATDELVQRVELQRAVADAVLALAEPYRSAVLLRYFEALAPRDIAARLDVPVETVRTRLKRALEQLRARLDAKFGARGAWSAVILPWIGCTKPAVIATSTASAATGTGGVATAGGAIVMQASTKFLLAAIGVVAIGATVWQWRARSAARAGGETTATSQPSTSQRGATKRASDLPATADRPSSTAATRTAEPNDVDAVNAAANHLASVELTARVVDEETHAPLAGATLTAHYSLDGVDRTVTANSQSDGTLVLTYGPSDHAFAQLTVVAADHVHLESPAIWSESDAPIRDGKWKKELGDVALERGAALAGRVVRLPDRAPIADAELYLLDRAPWGSGSDFLPNDARAVGRSRPDGTFAIDERASAKFRPDTLFAVTPTGVGWAFVSVVKGRERLDDVEVVLEPPATLDARVVDELGNPLKNVDVIALPKFAPLGAYSRNDGPTDVPWITAPGAWSSLFKASTDADGVATLPCLPEGRDDPQIREYGGNMRSYRVFAAAERCEPAIAPVQLKSGSHESVKLVLRRVHEIVVKGRLHDEHDQPVADAQVRSLDTAVVTTSDEAGLYEFSPFVPSGPSLAIEVTAEGFGLERWEGDRARLAKSTQFTRDENGRVTREEIALDFALEHVSPIAGMVVDDLGQPVERVGVMAQRFDSDPRPSGAIPRNAVTGPDGRFSIDNVTIGDWLLQLSPPTGFREPTPRTVHAGERDVVLRLVRAPEGTARLVAEIVDAASGAPLDPTEAYAWPTELHVRSMPSAKRSQGQVLASGLFVGKWRLNVVTSDGRRGHRDFEIVHADDEVHLRLELGANAGFDGKVTMADGSPLPENEHFGVFVFSETGSADATGHAVDANGRRRTDVTDGYEDVDADGTFRFADVEPDTALRIWLSGHTLFAETTLVLHSGEQRHVELHAVVPGTLEFQVAQELPGGDLKIFVSRDDGDSTARTWIASATQPRVGKPIRKVPVSPGRLHWFAEFVSNEESRPTVQRASGEVDAVAGQTTVVAVKGLQ